MKKANKKEAEEIEVKNKEESISIINVVQDILAFGEGEEAEHINNLSDDEIVDIINSVDRVIIRR